MKKAIVFLWIFFAFNPSLAATSDFPTYEQARKLAAAAWKLPPRSIDITYYVTIKDNTKTEENLRLFYKEHFDKEYGPDDKLSPEALEKKKMAIQLNVEIELAEQKEGGRKLKCRVRYDGNSYRIDQVEGTPEATLLKGTTYEEFRLRKNLDAGVPFVETVIETPVATGGFERYKYHHENQIASIEKSDGSLAAGGFMNVYRLFTTPYTSVLRISLGTQKNNLRTESYDVNETNLRKLCSGTLENISIKIELDPNEPDAKDRIEICIFNDEKTEFSKALMICARDDYSKVYYCDSLTPVFNKSPKMINTYSDYDNLGFPHNVTNVQCNDKGEILVQQTIKIENVRVNIPFAKNVFEFNPPDYYVVTDYRLPEAERLAAKIESMKHSLKSALSSDRRLETLAELAGYLKDKPEQLRDVCVSLLKDRRDDIRSMVLISLTSLMRDDPEGLRKIAISMQDDEDPLVQIIVEQILQHTEPENKDDYIPHMSL